MTKTPAGNMRVLMARKEQGLTQGDLAGKLTQDNGFGKRIPLVENDIVRIERYGWIPPNDVRKQIAKLLRSSESALFDGLPTTTG